MTQIASLGSSHTLSQPSVVVHSCWFELGVVAAALSMCLLMILVFLLFHLASSGGFVSSSCSSQANHLLVTLLQP
jgi:hypothetical protein